MHAGILAYNIYWKNENVCACVYKCPCVYVHVGVYAYVCAHAYAQPLLLEENEQAREL